MPSRRDVLRTACVAGVVGAAGCSAVPAPRPKMDVGVTNHRENDVVVTVKFFDESVTEYSDALVHRERFEVPGGTEEVVHEDALPDRAYRVSVLERASHHYHYRPDCGGDAAYPPGLLVTFLEGTDVRFSQTTCSDDEPFL